MTIGGVLVKVVTSCALLRRSNRAWLPIDSGNQARFLLRLVADLDDGQLGICL
jgi:hypothetical protein